MCNFELSGTPARVRLWPNKAVYPHATKLLKVTPVATTPTANNSTPTAPKPDLATTQDSGSRTASNTSSLQQTDPTADSSSVHHILDWPLLQQLLQAGHWTGAGSMQLLAGGNDALLPARYDTSDRLVVQVAGRQRVMLLPPGQAFRGVYPYPVHHPYDGYSAVDWEEPELDHWPAAAQVSGHRGVWWGHIMRVGGHSRSSAAEHDMRVMAGVVHVNSGVTPRSQHAGTHAIQPPLMACCFHASATAALRCASAAAAAVRFAGCFVSCPQETA